MRALLSPLSRVSPSWKVWFPAVTPPVKENMVSVQATPLDVHGLPDVYRCHSLSAGREGHLTCRTQAMISLQAGKDKLTVVRLPVVPDTGVMVRVPPRPLPPLDR